MRISVIFLFLMSFSPLYAIDVYVVCGQSNGWNISKLRNDVKKEKEDQYKVYYYGMKCVSEPNNSSFKVLKKLDENYGGFGLANALRQKSKGDIVFIQFCRCGSPIHETTSRMTWYPGENPKNGKLFNEGLYNLFSIYLEHAKEELINKYGHTWDLKGVFWHQGESETHLSETIEAYPQNLKNLLTRFRMDLGSDLKIVGAHIRELKENDKKINAVLNQRAKADPLFTVVESNDLSFRPDKNGKSDVHFNEAGAIALGERMAAKLKSN